MSDLLRSLQMSENFKAIYVPPPQTAWLVYQSVSNYSDSSFTPLQICATRAAAEAEVARLKVEFPKFVKETKELEAKRTTATEHLQPYFQATEAKRAEFHKIHDAFKGEQDALADSYGMAGLSTHDAEYGEFDYQELPIDSQLLGEQSGD